MAHRHGVIGSLIELVPTLSDSPVPLVRVKIPPPSHGHEQSSTVPISPLESVEPLGPLACTNAVALTAAVESAATVQNATACASQGGGSAAAGRGLATLTRPDRASLRKQIEPTEKGPYIARLNVGPIASRFALHDCVVITLRLLYDRFVCASPPPATGRARYNPVRLDVTYWNSLVSLLNSCYRQDSDEAASYKVRRVIHHPRALNPTTRANAPSPTPASISPTTITYLPTPRPQVRG